MRRLPLVGATLALCLLAGPARAEFYRWTDESGREHFAQSLHQVPEAHRAAAKAAAATDTAAPTVNYHDAPAREPTSGARSVAQEAAPPAARAPSPDRCEALRRKLAEKEKLVRIHSRSVEANQRWADDISRSAFSRRRYEAKAEEEGGWLAKAERDLERFLDAQRERGVPPGCLR